MNIEVNDKGVLELREVFEGISLITRDYEKIHIAMRDSGFEFNYSGVHYEAKNGEIRKLNSGGKFKGVDTHQTPGEFIPRKFKALIDEWGLDDFGASGKTFKIKSLERGKIYEEMDPKSIDGNQLGVVIDDNGCWWHYGDKNFKKRFEEII